MTVYVYGIFKEGCAVKGYSSIIDKNDLHHGAQVSVYLRLCRPRRPARRRGAACVWRTASGTTSTRSGTTPPCRPSGARAAASRTRAPTLTPFWFVCVCAAAHRPASRFRQMPDASRELPAASGQQPGPARSAAVAEQCGCAATAPFSCPVLFGAGAAARGDRR